MTPIHNNKNCTAFMTNDQQVAVFALLVEKEII
jgi:hypothetical protein